MLYYIHNKSMSKSQSQINNITFQLYQGGQFWVAYRNQNNIKIWQAFYLPEG